MDRAFSITTMDTKTTLSPDARRQRVEALQRQLHDLAAAAHEGRAAWSDVEQARCRLHAAEDAAAE